MATSCAVVHAQLSTMYCGFSSLIYVVIFIIMINRFLHPLLYTRRIDLKHTEVHVLTKRTKYVALF